MSLLQTSIYKYVPDLYCIEACLTGFRGAQRDANTQMPDVQQQHADEQHCNQELNHILAAHVVDSAVTTFGCVEWESQLFRGVMRARCYPFNLPKRRFHSFNPQVYCTLIHIGTYQYVLFTYLYIPGLYEYVQQYTKNDIVVLLKGRQIA